MTSLAFLLILCSVLCVGVLWALPRRLAQNGVAAVTFVSLVLVSSPAALWLGTTTLVTPLVMRIGERTGYRGLAAGIWICALALALIVSREAETFRVHKVIWIGGAYFTLRHIHVLMDWWFGRLSIPDLGSYIRYQFFLPTLMAGPINRIQVFERQCARRRWDATDFFSGAERTLFGMALAVIVGSFVFTRLNKIIRGLLEPLHSFTASWLMSAVDWIQLYVTFSALTHIALGISLMMGLQLEENFNKPWRARSLIEFWQRWHMTLSHWCRDYVFAPLTAYTRSPIIGVAGAMLVLGLWHQASMYYVFWAVWQALGIVLTRLYMRAEDPLGFMRLPERVQMIAGPLSVLAWLSLTRPTFEIILQWTKT